MDDDDDIVTTLPAVKLRGWDVAIVLVDGIGSVFGSIESVFDDIVRMMAMHANWRNEREKIAVEMRESIERIVSE